MPKRISISIRERDEKDFERIHKLVKRKDKNLSKLFMQFFRQWERRVTK